MSPAGVPTLRIERELLAGGAPVVLACDEVGRGALAGPVTVGIVVIDATIRRMPAGLRDSKLLPEPKRLVFVFLIGGSALVFAAPGRHRWGAW